MHSKAQYLSPLELSWRMHCGLAEVPAGTSVGHEAPPVHFGAQSSPSAPCTEASVSSLRQGGFS